MKLVLFRGCPLPRDPLLGANLGEPPYACKLVVLGND
jgi:hypothetical protein